MITLLRGAHRIDGSIERAHDEMGGIRCGDGTFFVQIVVRQNVLPKGAAVLGAKPVTTVVAIASELGGAALGPDISAVRIETEIAAADRHLRDKFDRFFVCNFPGET